MDTKPRRRRRSRSRRSRRQYNIQAKRLPALLLVPLLGLLITVAFQQMKANVVHSQTRQYLNFWASELADSRGGYTLSSEAIATALQGAERSSQLEPAAPEYHLAVAKVVDWVVSNGQNHGVIVSRKRQALGLQAYRQAISLRPAWPYTWADFAMAKARANEIDQEFFHALERAMALGSWEPTVMETIVRLGLWYAPQLPDNLGQHTNLILTRYVKSYPRQAVAIASSLQKTERVCALLENPEWFRKECQP